MRELADIYERINIANIIYEGIEKNFFWIYAYNDDFRVVTKNFDETHLNDH